jgi:hypothetical protein
MRVCATVATKLDRLDSFNTCIENISNFTVINH